MSTRFTFFNYLDSILLSSLIAVTLSLIFMLLTQWIPRKMTSYSLIAGCVTIVIMAIFILVFPSSFLLVRILMAIVLLVLLFSIYSGWKNEKGTFRLFG